MNVVYKTVHGVSVMEKHTVFKTTSGQYFVSVRIRNRTVFGGTFQQREDALLKAKQLTRKKVDKSKRIVCMY